MSDLIVMEIFEPLQDLSGVEADGGFVVLQRAPFRPQQGRQASWIQTTGQSTIHINTFCFTISRTVVYSISKPGYLLHKADKICVFFLFLGVVEEI